MFDFKSILKQNLFTKLNGCMTQSKSNRSEIHSELNTSQIKTKIQKPIPKVL